MTGARNTGWGSTPGSHSLRSSIPGVVSSTALVQDTVPIAQSQFLHLYYLTLIIMSEDTSTSSAPPRPRARLGPTEIVNLPASDSEPEDDDSFVEINGAGVEDVSFLKDYSEETEVGISPLTTTPLYLDYSHWKLM